MMFLPTASYAVLAKCALAVNDQSSAESLIRRYLQLCFENGIYEYFKIRKEYDPMLEFAYNHGIEPDITMEIMRFSGYKIKKTYIQTFGTFAVFPYSDRQKPLKYSPKRNGSFCPFT